MFFVFVIGAVSVERRLQSRCRINEKERGAEVAIHLAQHLALAPIGEDDPIGGSTGRLADRVRFFRPGRVE